MRALCQLWAAEVQGPQGGDGRGETPAMSNRPALQAGAEGRAGVSAGPWPRAWGPPRAGPAAPASCSHNREEGSGPADWRAPLWFRSKTQVTTLSKERKPNGEAAPWTELELGSRSAPGGPPPGRRQGPRGRQQRRGTRPCVRVTRSPASSVVRDTRSSGTETAARPRWRASLPRSPLGNGPSPRRGLPARPPGPTDEAPGPREAAEARVRTWHSGPRPCWRGLRGRRGGERAGLPGLGTPPAPQRQMEPLGHLSLVTGARGCCHRGQDSPAREHRLRPCAQRRSRQVTEVAAEGRSSSSAGFRVCLCES